MASSPGCHPAVLRSLRRPRDGLRGWLEQLVCLCYNTVRRNLGRLDRDRVLERQHHTRSVDHIDHCARGGAEHRCCSRVR